MVYLPLYSSRIHLLLLATRILIAADAVVVSSVITMISDCVYSGPCFCLVWSRLPLDSQVHPDHPMCTIQSTVYPLCCNYVRCSLQLVCSVFMTAHGCAGQKHSPVLVPFVITPVAVSRHGTPCIAIQWMIVVAEHRAYTYDKLGVSREPEHFDVIIVDMHHY